MKKVIILAMVLLTTIIATAQTQTTDKVYYQKYDNVKPENILNTILDKHKDRVVLIDIWATWCPPCRTGHELMKPIKEEYKGKAVDFVYVTCQTSPVDTWNTMIKDIAGEHYYLTQEQYQYLIKLYESQGIPTYAMYGKDGKLSFKSIGYMGDDVLREEINKALGK